MIETALSITVVLFVLATLLAFWRLVVGPSLLDRVLALDTLYINAIGLALLLGLRFQTDLLFEAALVIALLGFLGTVALARFAERGDLIRRHD
jgi:multicomponent K+:H+ antiporter subunit F